MSMDVDNPQDAVGRLDESVRLDLPHRVRFVHDAFEPASTVLLEAFGEPAVTDRRVLIVADQGLVEAQGDLQPRIERYFQAHHDRLPQLVGFRSVPGGEAAKNDLSTLESLLGDLNRLGIDRQSHIMAIGGGAVLDMVGFAAAVTHRGVRLVRLPTTTLGVCDSGVGVKNGVNMFGKKNFIGTFAVPQAVVNDLALLRSLTDRDWRCGLSEAVKVALLKSPSLYRRITDNADALAGRDEAIADPIWQASARLHYQHIVGGGDPFELDRARPLDFGHWAGHKLEQLSDFDIRHGEAVAMGLAIDVRYAAEIGLLPHAAADAVVGLLGRLGFDLWRAEMADARLLDGLEEFREHLGGQLTITLIGDVGQPVDLHEIDGKAMRRAIQSLADAPAVAPASVDAPPMGATPDD